jgi:glycosyltransferase involved in cell wall biosynthesis
LNVCFISEPLFPIDGTASRTFNLARALASRGHNIFILALRESLTSPSDELYEKCRIIRFERGEYPAKFYRERRKTYMNFFFKGESLHFYKKIINVVKSYDIDVLYCSNYLPSMMGIAFRKFIRKPIICDLQASVSSESRQRGAYLESIIGKMVEKITFDITDGVTVPVPEYKEYLSTISRKAPERCYVVPSCVNINQFTPYSNIEVRSKLGLPLQSHLLFFHGAPYPENFRALEMLTQIVDDLNKAGLETKALVAGNFENKLSQSPNIIFTGWLSQEKLARYINVSDIAVLPIYTKCMGISTRAIEYMASGKATITTKDGATGLGFATKVGGLIAVDTLEEITNAAALLLQDKQLCKSIGRTARSITEKHLSPEAIGLQLESIFDEILIHN